MLNNWMYRQPTKYWALSLSLLGLGACSSTKSGTDTTASDYSYVDAPSDTVGGGAEGSAQSETTIVAGSGPRRSGGAAYRESQFPEIANRAFQKDGYWLNGYVFVRNESNWQEISRLLYGRTDRAALLAQWNAGSEVKPGAVIYYNSPFRADDTRELKSFDSDFGMTLTGVAVSAGDSLSGLAAKLYGNPDAWRELASLNADLLKSPDRLEVGQSLRVAPAVRDTSSILQAYVQKVQNEAQVALTEKPIQNDQVANAADAMQDQQSLEAEGAQAPPAAEGADSGSKFKLPANTIQIAVGLLALLLVAGGVAYSVRRRKQLAAENASNTIFFGKKTGTED